MKKVIRIALVLVFAWGNSFAELDPKETAKSLVKVMVTGAGKANICSGFIWQNDDWVVTSLHAMKRNGKIEVQYLNKYWRDAEVYKVLAKSDLVLLKVDLSGDNQLPGQVKAISEFKPDGVGFDEALYAQGYHGGADGHRTQKMSKGDADPETLEYVVVKKETKDKLFALGFPKIDLPIYYLNGSLLPGYSGCPIYNKSGDLVGIGDGGLEGGQVNVSWAIPAKFLNDLVNSQTAALPPTIDNAGVLFSAVVQVDVTWDGPKDVESYEADIQAQLDKMYSSYGEGDFQFFQTKNRSFLEMFNTSNDPENLLMFAEEFENNNILMDYYNLGYDIYEDVNHGMVIAVPEFCELIYDPLNKVFSADLSFYGENQSYYFGLMYGGYLDNDAYYEDIDMAVDELLTVLNQTYGAAVNGFVEDPNYSYILELDNNREIAYILYQGANNFLDDNGNELALQFYLTVLFEDNKIFFTLATITIPVFEVSQAFQVGIDCVNNTDEINKTYCNYFEMMMRVVGASHLTTFANTQIAGTRK
jgi:hypothetical protein